MDIYNNEIENSCRKSYRIAHFLIFNFFFEFILSTFSKRTGNVEHFGYGNVTTGQVASRKYEILTRASSVGVTEREGLNPDLTAGLSLSARASPAPMQMKTMATDEGADMSVQVNKYNI